MDDYGDEDEVSALLSSFVYLIWIDRQLQIDFWTGFFSANVLTMFREFCVFHSLSLSSAGVAGVDGQNQWETREEHQTAGSGGQTRQRSWRERPHLLSVGQTEKSSRRVVNRNANIKLSYNSGFSVGWNVQVPAETLRPDVSGPSVLGYWWDLQAAGRGAHLPVYDGWDAALRPAGLLLPPHAPCTCWSRPTGASDACQVCPPVDWNPYVHQH